MLLFIIVSCIVIAICRRRNKATQKPNALEMESYSNPRSNTIYTGMESVKEKPPTYANFQQESCDRDSLFKLPETPARIPDTPEKTDAIYAIPHDKTQILREREPKAYENPDQTGEYVTKDSTEAWELFEIIVCSIVCYFPIINWFVSNSFYHLCDCVCVSDFY